MYTSYVIEFWSIEKRRRRKEDLNCIIDKVMGIYTRLTKYGELVLNGIWSVGNRWNCTTYTVRYSLFDVHCTTYIEVRILYDVHCTTYIEWHTLYDVHWSTYIVRCSLYDVQCTPYIVQRTFYVYSMSDYTYSCRTNYP